MKKERSGIKLPVYLWIVIFGACFWIVSGMGFYIYANYIQTSEDKIKISVNLIVLSAEQKAARVVMTQIAEDYSDAVGQDYKTLSQNMRYWCGKNLQEKIDINLADMKIVVAPDNKTAEVTFTVSGSRPVSDVLKYARSDGRFHLKYINVDGTWLIKSYEPVK